MCVCVCVCMCVCAMYIAHCTLYNVQCALNKCNKYTNAELTLRSYVTHIFTLLTYDVWYTPHPIGMYTCMVSLSYNVRRARFVIRHVDVSYYAVLCRIMPYCAVL